MKLRVAYLGILIFVLISPISSIGKFSLKRDTKQLKEKPRTLHGLLAFLTGYNLGQGLGVSSYHADIRDNAQLHFFAKLFNSALSVTYGRPNYLYPQFAIPIVYPMHDGHLPVYPPLVNIPLNQQQIVNVNEAPKESAEEKYEELHLHTAQNIESNKKTLETRIGSNDEETRTTIEDNEITVEGAESTKVTTQIPFSFSRASVAFEANSTNSNLSTTTTSSMTLTTTPASAMTNSSNSTDSKPSIITPAPPHGKYPYPVYHFYSNKSAYENIAITNSPILNSEDSSKFVPDTFDNYLPSVDSPKVQFAPSNNNFKYYPSPYDNDKPQRYSSTVGESEFRPIDNNYYEIYNNFNKSF